MRKFIVNVNGTEYEVEVEEVTQGKPAAPVAAPVKPVAPVKEAAAPVKPAAPAKEPEVSGTAGAVNITAPMPGTILNVFAAVGQQVKKGDVVAILEAMKMENEIIAPKDGVISSVNTQKGSSVNTNDTIVTMN